MPIPKILKCINVLHLSIDRICPSQNFLCANDKCLAAYYMCDGNNDCGDNSDESTICSGNDNCLIK